MCVYVLYVLVVFAIVFRMFSKAFQPGDPDKPAWLLEDNRVDSLKFLVENPIRSNFNTILVNLIVVTSFSCFVMT